MKEILVGLGIIGGAILGLYLIRLILGIISVVVANLWPNGVYISHTYENYMDYGIKGLIVLIITACILFAAALIGYNGNRFI